MRPDLGNSNALSSQTEPQTRNNESSLFSSMSDQQGNLREGSRIQENSGDHMDASSELSVSFKIFADFLQTQALALSLDLLWSKSMRYILGFQAMLVGFVSGSPLEPIDCLLETAAIPGSIGALLLRFAFPLAAFILFYCKSKFTKKASFMQLLVVFYFFALLPLAENSMRSLAFVDFDQVERTDHRNMEFTRPLGSMVWAEDTSLLYFHGLHLCASVVGIIVIAILAIAWVCGFIWLLVKKKVIEGEEGDREEFKKKYGYMAFMYDAYKPSNPISLCWEFVLILKKVLISMVTVFAYQLGPVSQAILAAAILCFFLLLHSLIRPYKEPAKYSFTNLNNLECLSLLVSCISFLTGAIFNVGKSELVKRIMVKVAITSIGLLILLLLDKCFLVLDVVLSEKLEECREAQDNLQRNHAKSSTGKKLYWVFQNWYKRLIQELDTQVRNTLSTARELIDSWNR